MACGRMEGSLVAQHRFTHAYGYHESLTALRADGQDPEHRHQARNRRPIALAPHGLPIPVAPK